MKFSGGCIILILANIFSKMLFILFLYYLSFDTINIGLKYYTYAYIPYSIFLDLSSFGIMPGVAKLISKEEIKKQYYILKIGTIYTIILGIVFFVLLNITKDFILSHTISDLSINEINAINNNLIIASITITLYPIINFYKGYLQGTLKYLPSGISILLESSTRVTFYFLIRNNITNYNDFYKIYIINLLSYMVSLLPLIIFIFKYYFKRHYKHKCLFKIIKHTIPFGIVTLFFTFYQLIDSLMLINLGISDEIYMAYMFESIRLIFIPISISTAIGSILNPKISKLKALDEVEETKLLVRKTSNLIIKILIPILLIYLYYSEDLYYFFYHKKLNDNILLNTSYLIFFIGFYKTLIGLCSGLDKFNYIIITTFIAILSKVILNYILVIKFNYIGSILATIISITLCILVSYYILYKNKITMLLNNLYITLKTILISLIALMLCLIYKAIVPISSYNKLIELTFFSIIFIGFYLAIVTFFNLLTKSYI